VVEPAAHSLGAVLGVGEVDEDELYRALDLLGAVQPAIEKALARRRLKDGMLVLYDVTSSYLEGRCCELARFGYSSDGPSLQLLFALMIAVSRRRPPCPGPLPAGTPLERSGASVAVKRLYLLSVR
jgi:hypothetical protein